MRWMGDKWDKALLVMLAAAAFFAIDRWSSAVVLMAFMLLYFFFEMSYGGGQSWYEAAQRWNENRKRNSRFEPRHKRSGRPR